jgi:2-polyprenyl-6-methoxyphenol hydroxylase-like FAD-dependent oxidoreductase
MSQTDYDIITVGGGLAGAALSASMAAAGARVLIIERETEFHDRVRGEWLAPWGVAEVRHLGLMNALNAGGAHPSPNMQNRSGKPRRVENAAGDVPVGFYHPDAQEALLAEAARRGAEVIRGEKVLDIRRGILPEVSISGESGHHELSARLVVGADGRSSLARKATGQEHHIHRSPRLLAGVRISNLPGPQDTADFLIRDDARGLASIFPQGNGYARAYVFLDGATASTFNRDGGFERFIDAAIESGIPAERIQNVTQAGPLAAFVAGDSWVDSAYSRGIALIGDAAGMSDPTWGMGMSLAFRDARALRDALLADDYWPDAGNAYATAHREHFNTVMTVEDWYSELLLTPGVAAQQRRVNAARLWSQDPSRMPDLPGVGPGLDSSDLAHDRFFGEDTPQALAA